MQNLAGMADLADRYNVQVVLCAVPPMGEGPVELGPRIRQVNAHIKAMAQARRHPFVDYYTALADQSGHLPPQLAPDGVHPDPAGYARMWPALKQALRY